MSKLETPRLILEPLSSAHQDSLLRLHNDPLVRDMFYGGEPQTAEHVQAMVDKCLLHWRNNGLGIWIVYRKTDSGTNLIGRCGLRAVDGTNYLELNYAFGQAGVGQGLGPEAARAAITHALTHSNAEKVVAFVAHWNDRAKRAAEKLGLRYIDDRYRYQKLWGYYEMTREEYLSQSHYDLAVMRRPEE